jgi:hypothetical protein
MEAQGLVSLRANPVAELKPALFAIMARRPQFVALRLRQKLMHIFVAKG